MKNSTKIKNTNDFTIKDVFADRNEQSIRRIVQDSNDKLKDYRKTETAKILKTFEERVCTK